MPYTPMERRPVNSTEFDAVKLETKGDLTAAIFDLQLRFLNTHEVSYQNISDAIASASDAADEIKRRVRDPYEDECIKKNGDFPMLTVYKGRIYNKFRPCKTPTIKARSTKYFAVCCEQHDKHGYCGDCPHINDFCDIKDVEVKG
jgi:hypothetical protein